MHWRYLHYQKTATINVSVNIQIIENQTSMGIQYFEGIFVFIIWKKVNFKTWAVLNCIVLFCDYFI